MITDFLTSANGKTGQTTLNEKTKKVYNILGDYPDVIAEYLVNGIEKNNKNEGSDRVADIFESGI